MHAYERWVVLQYFCALLKLRPFEKAPRSNEDIIGWIKSHGRSLGLPPLSRVEESAKKGAADGNLRIRADDWREWRTAVFGRQHDRAPAPSRLQKRIIWLAENCGLSIPSAICSGLSHGSHTTACALIWSRPETKSLNTRRSIGRTILVSCGVSCRS